MQLSIRLQQEIETQLCLHLQQEGIELSEFVRDAICEKLAKDTQGNSPYELGRHLFGRYASGDPLNSTNRKQILRKKIHDKYCP